MDYLENSEKYQRRNYMSGLVIVGAQWGDEGKGKLTDYLTHQADMVVRYQGGNNAGHTVIIGENEFKLHLIPSGIFYKDKLAIIGNGVVVNPKALLDEIQYLKDKQVTVDNLRISDRAHIVFPYHIEIDRLKEEKRGEAKIGTTIKGIGPCYMDKFERIGIRMCDYYNKALFEEKLRKNIQDKNEYIVKMHGGQALDEDQIVRDYLTYMEAIKPFIMETSEIVEEAIVKGQKVLFEGAQGMLLDIDYGTYPYVTSSHPIAAGVPIGAGVSTFAVSKVLGIVKAYTTRVGKGPFTTELEDATGEALREKGHEYGVTTGRARRCGWLDVVMLKYSTRINGFTSFALTKLDTLAGFEKVKICVAYEKDGVQTTNFPASLELLKDYKPVYIEMDGWTDAEMEGVLTYDALPANAKAYIEKIEELTKVPVHIVSVGPKRDQTIFRSEVF